MEKMYMNPLTGSVDTYDGWAYVNKNGRHVNAVDLEEVIEVVKSKDGNWIEPHIQTAAIVLGSRTSEAKAAAARENGKKGGRPKTTKDPAPS